MEGQHRVRNVVSLEEYPPLQHCPPVPEEKAGCFLTLFLDLIEVK
jgi:hypothetical protein